VVTLSHASLNFRQQLTLDPNHKPGLPNLAQVDGRLIGPITDFFTFYVDVWLSENPAVSTRRGSRIIFSVLGSKAWKSLRQPIPPLEFPKQEIYDFPGSVYLRKVPPLNDVHLLNGNFKIVRQMNEIPVNANRIRW